MRLFIQSTQRAGLIGIAVTLGISFLLLFFINVLSKNSEAAALFIGEGLAVRASELDRLEEALHDVHAARERLRRAARDAVGLAGPDELANGPANS